MVVIAAVWCTPPKPLPERNIRGVFVEMNGKHDWKRVLESPNVHEIIIANVHGYDDQSKECKRPKGCSKVSEALALLKAVPTGKDVYVGLAYDAQFDVAKLGDAQKDDYRIAKAFWDAAVQHNVQHRITGWYLAREWHNFGVSENNAIEIALQNYLEGISDDLLKEDLPKRPLVVAPFFVPQKYCSGFRTATETATLFTELLKNTRVKLLLLQDGFAERKTRSCTAKLTVSAYATEAAAYAQALAVAMEEKAHVRFGVDLEAFKPGWSIQCRLHWQFKSVPDGAPVFVYQQRDCLKRKLCQ